MTALLMFFNYSFNKKMFNVYNRPEPKYGMLPGNMKVPISNEKNNKIVPENFVCFLPFVHTFSFTTF